MRRGKTLKTLQREVDAFNARCPVGDAVRFWTGTRRDEPRVSHTEYPAMVLERHTAVVWIKGAGYVALTHVEPLAGVMA